MAVFHSNRPSFEKVVENVQELLNKHGFNVGAVDGDLGPNTYNQATFVETALQYGRISEADAQEIRDAFKPILEAMAADPDGLQVFYEGNGNLLEHGANPARLPGYSDFVEERLETLDQKSVAPVEPHEAPYITPDGSSFISPDGSYLHDAIKNLQQALNDNGYDCGAVDGDIGPRCIDALDRYYDDRAHGLPPNPEIEDALDGLANYPELFIFIEAQRSEKVPEANVQAKPGGEPNDTAFPPVSEVDEAVLADVGDGAVPDSLCDDIMALQGFLGIPEEDQAPVIGQKTIEGTHRELKEVFGDNWSQALEAMKDDSRHSGPEWEKFSQERPEMSALMQQLDEVKDPRYQGDSGPSIFDTLIPNGSPESNAPVEQSNDPGIAVDCDSSSVDTCSVDTVGGQGGNTVDMGKFAP